MTNTNLNPRMPSKAERGALVRHMAEQMYYPPGEDDYREAESLVARAAICVFDGYVPDCPGTTSDIMLVVWPGHIGLYEAYLVKAGEIRPVSQQEALRSADSAGVCPGS